MRTQRRAAVAALIALCGLAIAAGSALTWISARGRRPSSGIRHTALAGLLHWSYQHTASFAHSFAAVVVVSGVLVFAGGVLASKALSSLFSFVALAACGVWIGLNATHYSPVHLPFTDLRMGALLVLGGSLAGLVCSFFVRHGAA